MSYFEEGDTVPPPFNLFPTPKTFIKLLQCKSKRSTMSVMVKTEMNIIEFSFKLSYSNEQYFVEKIKRKSTIATRRYYEATDS